MAWSQNGWPVDPPRSARTIPGTSVKVTVADGPAGDVLMYVLAQIDRRVEDIDLRSTRGEFDDWGYANRNVRGDTSISNHASATAVDVNATRHPLGVAGTFSPAQVAEIHRILAEVDHVVRWGGDYTGRKDEMHFEINASRAAVERVAARVKEADMPLTENDIRAIWAHPIKFQALPTNPGGPAWMHLSNGNLAAQQANAQLTGLTQAVVKLSNDPDITVDEVRSIMTTAVTEATPTAAQIAEAQRPYLDQLIQQVLPDTVRAAVAAAQQDDNLDLAQEIVRLTGEKLQSHIAPAV